jgi:3-oxoadipate enol-lactonase
MPHSRVGDVDLYYEISDFTEPWRPTRAPVVFLHGLGGDQRFWLYQVPAFCSRFPVIALDLRGHGLSSKPAMDWTMADMGRDVVRLLRNLGVERAHLVGVSLGGMVAQQIAVDTPYAIASLVLGDTLCGVPEEMDGMAAAGVEFMEENSMAAIAKQRITAAFSDSVDPVMRDYFIDRVARNDKQSYVRTARAIAQFSLRRRMDEIAAPTLVIVGERDRVTPPELSEELANGIRGASLVCIPRAGHISNLERPEQFNRAALDFLLAQ